MTTESEMELERCTCRIVGNVREMNCDEFQPQRQKCATMVALADAAPKFSLSVLLPRVVGVMNYSVRVLLQGHASTRKKPEPRMQ